VAAIRAGNIDTSKLAIKPAEAAFQAPDRTALAKALTTLHSTLGKEQRAALVAAVEKHEGGPKGDKGAKHAGWNKDHGRRKHGPMRMLEGVDLTKEQKDAIHAKLEAGKPAAPTEAERAAMKTQHEAMRKEMEARLQTFVGDDFDANAFLAPPANAPAKPGFEGDHFVKELAVIVPLLTPAQREKLAQNLEKGPPAPAAK
jgi:Spy/CpxP family protein refolding chaperone